jgi:NADH-quinone oxidoreductase subunit G
MALVTIDNQPLEIGDDERLNCIQAALRLGIEIPHYCWHPGLSVVASCRMCLVEVGTRNAETGEIKMLPKLVPACQTPAQHGTVLVSSSERVAQARAMVEEELLLRHPIDCPICDKAGECFLQDYHFKYGQKERRADLRPFTSRRRPLGATVSLFVDRCVMCTRCVRFTREISGTSELMVTNRGSHEEIDVFPGLPLHNKLAGNVVDLCPVGALADKDFLYSQRVWFMQSHPHVCAGCSTGCSIHVDVNQDRIYRLRPRENPHVNRWWICDEGRYGFDHVHSERRLLEARWPGGERLPAGAASRGLGNDLTHALEADLRRAGQLAVVLSPHLTVEEAYLLVTFVRQFDAEAIALLGPVPQVGKDESFPGGFTIRAEKAPNRRGVEEVAAHFMDRPVDWTEFMDRARRGDVEAVWFGGGYPGDWIDEDSARAFASVPLVVVQDLFASPLSDLAHYVLPGAAFAEREGSYVNRADRLQSFSWAVRPPEGVLTEGRLLWKLLGREGLYRAPLVLEQITREIAYFSAALDGVSPLGVDLRSNLLVAST